jgi:hypothetical protein
LVLPRSIPTLVIALLSVSDLIFLKLLDMGPGPFKVSSVSLESPNLTSW